MSTEPPVSDTLLFDEYLFFVNLGGKELSLYMV